VFPGQVEWINVRARSGGVRYGTVPETNGDPQKTSSKKKEKEKKKKKNKKKKKKKKKKKGGTLYCLCVKCTKARDERGKMLIA